MQSVTHTSHDFVTLAGFRVSVENEIALIEETVDRVTNGLHAPFDGKPERLPHDPEPAAWRQWFVRSLPLGIRRVAELILAVRRQRSYGREWVRERILSPLCALNGDVPVPAPQSFATGSFERQVAEAAFAFARALGSVEQDEPRERRAIKVAEAQRGFGDLMEIKR